MAATKRMTDAAQTERFERDAPSRAEPGVLHKSCRIAWSETETAAVNARLWPHDRLMPRLTAQLQRLPTHRLFPTARTREQRVAFRPPAGASSENTRFAAALDLHRVFRFFLANDYWLEITILDGSNPEDGATLITVKPHVSHKPIAPQLQDLGLAATNGNPLEWEAAWRSLTPGAIAVLDAALVEAQRRKSKSLVLRPDHWIAGQIISSSIPSPELVAAVLPTAQKLAGRMRRPSHRPAYETLHMTLAWFHVLTGRRGDQLPQGPPAHPRGINVTFVRWLERCFCVLLVKRGSYSSWRRALRWKGT